MTRPNREQLLGYLLGALDADEQQELERQLDACPQWRDELDAIAQSLEPLSETAEDVEPPEGLAERTCAFVTHYRDRTTAPARRAMTPESLAPAPGLPWADVAVAAGIFFAAALLFFPAINNSQLLARRSECQYNLQQLGKAILDYSDKDTAGYIPYVPDEGKRSFAGIYSPLLCDGGYVDGHRVFICPSSEIAAQGGFRTVRLEEVDRASPNQLVWIRRMAGGSYGYSLGFVSEGRYRAARRAHASFAIMADAPDLHRSDRRSSNHGGRGQNLLFADGHVRFVVDGRPAGDVDHPFENHYGVVEAGVGEDDAVVAPSHAGPFFQSLSLRRF